MATDSEENPRWKAGLRFIKPLFFAIMIVLLVWSMKKAREEAPPVPHRGDAAADVRPPAPHRADAAADMNGATDGRP